MKPYKVYIGNLPLNVTKAQLYQLLFSLGTIPVSIEIAKNDFFNEPLGYAYIIFDQEEKANKVIRFLDGRKFGDLFLKSNLTI